MSAADGDGGLIRAPRERLGVYGGGVDGVDGIAYLGG